jgi:hypothetical protein
MPKFDAVMEIQCLDTTPTICERKSTTSDTMSMSLWKRCRMGLASFCPNPPILRARLLAAQDQREHHTAPTMAMSPTIAAVRYCWTDSRR